jgi:hypothetical protein
MVLASSMEQAVWAAAYGAYFANQVSGRMARGYNGPHLEEAIELEFHTEAACVAGMAVESFRVLEPEDIPI